ncbi:MAG: hypothetical protein Q4A27_00915 [bacterium]|nr:hypothetical protein [bacterium]
MAIINWLEAADIQAGYRNTRNSKLEPKLGRFEVQEKIEESYIKDDISSLIEWLTYAQVFRYRISESREFFRRIEEEWPVIQRDHPNLANKFNYLNSIFSDNYSTRNCSTQMCDYSAIIAELSWQ